MAKFDTKMEAAKMTAKENDVKLIKKLEPKRFDTKGSQNAPKISIGKCAPLQGPAK